MKFKFRYTVLYVWVCACVQRLNFGTVCNWNIAGIIIQMKTFSGIFCRPATFIWKEKKQCVKTHLLNVSCGLYVWVCMSVSLNRWFFHYQFTTCNCCFLNCINRNGFVSTIAYLFIHMYIWTYKTAKRPNDHHHLIIRKNQISNTWIFGKWAFISWNTLVLSLLKQEFKTLSSVLKQVFGIMGDFR